MPDPVISARIPFAIARALELAAKENGRSMSQEISARLEESVVKKKENLFSPEERKIAAKIINMITTLSHEERCIE